MLPRQEKAKGVHHHQTLLYEMLNDLFKKQKIKTMNNKMAINIYLSTVGSKKQTKQTRRRDRLTDPESILVVARGKG